MAEVQQNAIRSCTACAGAHCLHGLDDQTLDKLKADATGRATEPGSESLEDLLAEMSPQNQHALVLEDAWERCLSWVTRAYIPEAGDIVWMDISPVGQEMAGHRRRALVLSPVTYNAKTGLMVCCAVNDKAKGYPFEVPVVPAGGEHAGVVLADQVRCIDWRPLNVSRFAVVTPQCVLDVREKVRLLLLP